MQLTGAVDDSSLRFALLLEDCLDILGLQKTGDLIDTHLRPNGLVLAQHLCAQAGCRLASREVGTVHTRLVNDDIVVGRTGAKRGGEVIEQRGAGLDICGVRQDPKGGAVSWPSLRRLNPSNILGSRSEEERRGVSEGIDCSCPKGKQPKPAQMHGACSWRWRWRVMVPTGCPTWSQRRSTGPARQSFRSNFFFSGSTEQSTTKGALQVTRIHTH